jgi:hypothetical protein
MRRHHNQSSNKMTILMKRTGQIKPDPPGARDGRTGAGADGLRGWSSICASWASSWSSLAATGGL